MQNIDQWILGWKSLASDRGGGPSKNQLICSLCDNVCYNACMLLCTMECEYHKNNNKLKNHDDDNINKKIMPIFACTNEGKYGIW